MIHLSRLNGKEFVLNSDLIKYVESTPDTVITLVSGEKILVREKVHEVIDAALGYRKRISGEEPMAPA